MEFAIRLVVAILPVLTRFVCWFAPPELIAFVMNNEEHTHGHESRRKDEDQNPATQGLNHPSPRGGRLCIAKRATLGEQRKRDGQHDQSHQRNAKKQASLDLHHSPSLLT